MYFLSEEFWLILMSNWWAIVYLFFIPSICPAHDVINFIDFDWFRQSFWPLFDLKLLIFKPLLTLELEEILKNGKRRSSCFCCSFKFGNKKTFHLHFNTTSAENVIFRQIRMSTLSFKVRCFIISCFIFFVLSCTFYWFFSITIVHINCHVLERVKPERNIKICAYPLVSSPNTI